MAHLGNFILYHAVSCFYSNHLLCAYHGPSPNGNIFKITTFINIENILSFDEAQSFSRRGLINAVPRVNARGPTEKHAGIKINCGFTADLFHG